MQKKTSQTGRNSVIVYSTDPEWVPDLGENVEEISATTGIIYIGLEKKQRGGKLVTIIRGLPKVHVEETARKLKNQCAAGGTIKDDAIELQGDHRKKVSAYLQSAGYKVKLTGG